MARNLGLDTPPISIDDPALQDHNSVRRSWP